jgi:hypothetical protein
MHYFTIGQYFNKLNIALMLLLLLQIVCFIAAYTIIALDLSAVDVASLTLLHMALIACITWLILFFLFLKRIKSIRNDQGLGLKLEKYFQLTIVRYSVLGGLSILLVVGFFITRDDTITGVFAANLILAAWVWPRPAKICNDLKLRGDEREMVYFKKDFL